MKDLVALAMLCLPWLSIGCDDNAYRAEYAREGRPQHHGRAHYPSNDRTFTKPPCDEPAAYRRHEINRMVYFYSGGKMVGEWVTDQATIRHSENGRCRFTDSRSGNEVTISGDYLVVVCSAESVR